MDLSFLNNLSVEHGVYLGSGLGGLVLHYLKKRIKKQTTVGVVEYFGNNNPFASISTFAAYSAAMLGSLYGIDLDAMNMYVVALLGVSIGFTIDSSFNSVKEK